jgi:hypothetical protein
MDILKDKIRDNATPIPKLYSCFYQSVPFPDCTAKLLRVMLIPEVIYMASHSRCFPYEKSVVLNALYDIIEKLGLYLDSANSARGTFIVSNAEHTGRMRIAIDITTGGGQTKLEVYPEDGDTSFAETWSPIIIDELTGNMMRVYDVERRGKET